MKRGLLGMPASYDLVCSTPALLVPFHTLLQGVSTPLEYAEENYGTAAAALLQADPRVAAALTLAAAAAE